MSQQKLPPIYDPNKSYLENAEKGPFFNQEIPKRVTPPENEWSDFLGFKVITPIGIPAGPLLNSRWIELASKLGFDVLTYKTIRSHEHPSHPVPNVVGVEANEQLLPDNLPPYLKKRDSFSTDMKTLAITNSFGNPSRTHEYLQQDIPRAFSVLNPGQALIVSVFGTEREGITLTNDFAKAATFAKDCGAPIIEANYSCPNLKGDGGSLYSNPDAVFEISSKIVKEIGNTPLIIKMGLFPNQNILKQSMISAAKAGVRAICGINTISMNVVDREHNPALGPDRPTCGICGSPIREAALSFIRDAVRINKQEKLGLTIMGCGGITLPEHFDDFFSESADIAMTATGMMWDPFLSLNYQENKYATR